MDQYSHPTNEQGRHDIPIAIDLLAHHRGHGLGSGLRTHPVRRSAHPVAATSDQVCQMLPRLAWHFPLVGMLGSDLRVLGQFGWTVCIGLLLDTLIVRTLLMPSIATLLGRWFWWPQVVYARGDYAKSKAAQPIPANRLGRFTRRRPDRPRPRQRQRAAQAPAPTA